jgi:Protein of unknown function (DUF2946)
MKGSICMKWFRANARHGSRLALFALLVQFALSFGHFHAFATQAAPAPQTAPTQAVLASIGTTAPDAARDSAQRPQPSGHDNDQQPADPCAICAVIALANGVMFATPPVLLLPQAVELLHLTTDAKLVHLNSVRLAFQSRAPPISRSTG